MEGLPMAIFSTKNLQPKQEASIIKKHTILLVDDEQANLRVMSSLLNSKYHIITALNGQIALEMIENLGETELSMIISDQRMPQMTGVELLGKTVKLLPETMRLIVSGYSDISAILAAINKAKIYHFLTKPFEPDDFLAIVEQALQTYDLKKDMNKQFEAMQKKLALLEAERESRQTN